MGYLPSGTINSGDGGKMRLGSGLGAASYGVKAGAGAAAGAGAGAIGGAAAGTAIFPGIGTAIGAGAGAIIGGITGGLIPALEGGSSSKQRQGVFYSALQSQKNNVASRLKFVCPKAVKLLTDYQAAMRQVDALLKQSEGSDNPDVLTALSDVGAAVQEADPQLSPMNDVLTAIQSNGEIFKDGEGGITPHFLDNPALIALQTIDADTKRLTNTITEVGVPLRGLQQAISRANLVVKQDQTARAKEQSRALAEARSLVGAAVTAANQAARSGDYETAFAVLGDPSLADAVSLSKTDVQVQTAVQGIIRSAQQAVIQAVTKANAQAAAKDYDSAFFTLQDPGVVAASIVGNMEAQFTKASQAIEKARDKALELAFNSMPAEAPSYEQQLGVPTFNQPAVGGPSPDIAAAYQYWIATRAQQPIANQPVAFTPQMPADGYPVDPRDVYGNRPVQFIETGPRAGSGNVEFGMSGLRGVFDTSAIDDIRNRLSSQVSTVSNKLAKAVGPDPYAATQSSGFSWLKVGLLLGVGVAGFGAVKLLRRSKSPAKRGKR